jgi:hypothetical protein
VAWTNEPINHQQLDIRNIDRGPYKGCGLEMVLKNVKIRLVKINCTNNCELMG